MAQFRELVRQSKLFSLPPKGVKVRSKNVPRRQAIETTSAAKFRHNWGLKSPIPDKAQAKLMTVNRLDTPMGIPDVNYNAAFARRLQKFNELGFPVVLHPNPEFPSLFAAGDRLAKSLARMSEKERKHVIESARDRRSEYKHFVDSTAASRVPKRPAFSTRMGDAATANRPASRLPGVLESFMGLPSSSHMGPNDPSVSSTVIGLSYELKGVAHNTPEGIFASKPVRGRVLPKQGTKPAAVAGFVARMPRNEPIPAGAETAHQRPVVMRIDRATTTSVGDVNIQVNTFNDGAADDRESLGSIIDSSVGALSRIR
ncbi:Uncharacterized protein in HIS3 3'region [Wickerhamiella sorbophila]|uniref:Uncharacterized protein in HIS3 3'region n=1 Tax=Wickerhamiella sorbophila TaxID=45607 RepID=A0A2T0FMB6_9ASCO|nr:Uncharacterized protein in HIS3 3'region [Wickerhamiella sorbophila]PRT56131.1 Uncharacterized protein in HIS3 3'region [Wickerhamiella sorbophila]